MTTQTVIWRFHWLGMGFPANRATGRVQFHRSFSEPSAGRQEERKRAGNEAVGIGRLRGSADGPKARKGTANSSRWNFRSGAPWFPGFDLNG